MENKRILLRITNLKQYFPLKGGRFVKANDGISINIYEGETFGLVGESGCGKSTLGRTLLQLIVRLTVARSITVEHSRKLLPSTSWRRFRRSTSVAGSITSSRLHMKPSKRNTKPCPTRLLKIGTAKR